MKVIESYGGNTVEYSTGLTRSYQCYRISGFPSSKKCELLINQTKEREKCFNIRTWSDYVVNHLA